jgi:MarR family 2-MHQ and catechol resistance regulon transcriptional repressor
MPIHHQGSAEEVRALEAFVKLSRATDALQSAVLRSLMGEDLTPTQFGVMEALYHLGPLRPKTLAEKLLKSGANITTVLDNLVKKGLLRREASAEDRRSLMVHLTAKGRRRIAELFPRHAATISRLLSHLSPAEQAELSKLTKKLGLAVTAAQTTKE